MMAECCAPGLAEPVLHQWNCKKQQQRMAHVVQGVMQSKQASTEIKIDAKSTQQLMVGDVTRYSLRARAPGAYQHCSKLSFIGTHHTC